MSKKKNHSAEPSKLTRIRSFEEMKSNPFDFPSDDLARLQADYKELISQLRSNSSAEPSYRLKKTNKTISK